jgi:hypothetical protein
VLQDRKLLISCSATERVRLWDRYAGPIDQDAIKVEFFRKAHRRNPPFRFKVKLPPRNRVRVSIFKQKVWRGDTSCHIINIWWANVGALFMVTRYILLSFWHSADSHFSSKWPHSIKEMFQHFFFFFFVCSSDVDHNQRWKYLWFMYTTFLLEV